MRRGDRKTAVFKMADLHKCDVISIALVFKRSFQQHNKFISKNKGSYSLFPDIHLVLNIIFIELRMSGIKEYNLIQFICLRKEGRTGRQAGKKFSNNSGTYQNCLSNNSGAY